MTMTDTTCWWTSEAITALIDHAAVQNVLAHTEPVELRHSEITATPAEPGSPDQAYPGVAVVLRDVEPWLIHPHPAGWAATQAHLVDFGPLAPIEGTTGLLAGPDQDPAELIALLASADQLPIDLDQSGHVSTRRACVDDDEDRADFTLARDEALDRHGAYRAYRDNGQAQLDRVHLATNEHPAWLSELVAAIVGAGFSLDPHGPGSDHRYHRGGPQLTLHPDDSAVLKWTLARATVIQFGTAWADMYVESMNDLLCKILAGQRWPAAQLRGGGQVYITGRRIPVPDHTTSDETP